MTISGATNPSQSRPECDGNEGVLRIHQRSSITDASPSDCLLLCPWHSSGGTSSSPAEMQLLYSVAAADWAIYPGKENIMREGHVWIQTFCILFRIDFVYLSLRPNRHDLSHGQKPEGRLKWG